VNGQSSANQPTYLINVSAAPGSRASVGIATIDDHRLDPSRLDPLHAGKNGGSFDFVSSEKRSGCGRTL